MPLLKKKWRDELEYQEYKHPVVSRAFKSVLCIVACPLYCYLRAQVPPPHGGDGCVPGSYRKRKRARMADIHFERRRDLLQRRNSLSIGAPNCNPRQRITSDQAASLFFSKLPAEIRETIYEYALLGTGAIMCSLNTKAGIFPRLKATPCLPMSSPLEGIDYDTGVQKREASGYSLLQTCRLIYTEALPILYSHMQFAFDDQVTTLVAFSKATPTSQLSKIRSVRVDHTSFHLNPGYPHPLKVFPNLRVLYLVYFHDCYNITEDIYYCAEEMLRVTNCTIHVLVYSRDPPAVSSHVSHTGMPPKDGSWLRACTTLDLEKLPPRHEFNQAFRLS